MKKIVKSFCEAITPVLPPKQIITTINKPSRYSQKKSLTRTKETSPTPFRDNLYSYSIKNNFSYPDELVDKY
jgi:hypothetical protein